MAYEGYVDDATDQEIRGWIFDDGAMNESLLVEIVSGETLVARIKADQFRQDLQAVGKGNGKHGFSFKSDKPCASPLSARISGRRWVLPFSNAPREPMRVMSTLRHSLEYGRPSIPNGFSQPMSNPRFNLPNIRYSLLVNMDSFPEIHGEYVLAYLRQARQNVTSAFLSINQEARAPQHGQQRQTAVRELVKQAGGFKTAYRFRHWLRAGYVEELFRVSQTV